MNLQAMASFDHAHSKIIESTFSFPEVVTAPKKSVYSLCSFLGYSQFSSPVTRLATTTFYHAQSRNFQPPFNLREFVPAWKHENIELTSFVHS